MKLLIYTHKITPRLTYVFKHICTRILGVDVIFTTVVETFIAHQGLKMSYTKQPLGKELFVQSHYLLFEEGLSDVSLKIERWENTKCFFKVGKKSALPFDVFAASFYLLSRYEEYMPYVADDYGRFPPENSIAYQYHFLKQPVVDIWAYEFKKVLQEKFEAFQFIKKQFQIQPIVDVPVAYQYAQKGLVRTLGGVFRDLFSFKFKEIYQRFMVIFGFRRDAYDTFKWLINIHRKRKLHPVFFFLLGDYTVHDTSTDFRNKNFVSLIKSVSDYFSVGLKGSYQALENVKMLKEEKQRFENIFNIPLKRNRNSFSKLKLPIAYRNLINLEIQEDYTMGYVSESGFRAGTCTPFQFYDLDFEMQTPLRIHPFCMLDFVYKYNNKQRAFTEIKNMMQAVKKVNGTFSLVVHNYTFSKNEEWKGWRKFYTQILDEAIL